MSKSAESAKFRRKCQLTNYSGTKFDVEISREVRLLAPDEVWKKLGVTQAAGVKMVAFESVNRITNAGKEAWKKDTGLLSIWILCMFNPSPETTIVVPIKAGPESQIGPDGQCRLLRQGAAGTADREGQRGLLQRRRQVPQQDRRHPRSAASRCWAATTRRTKC